MSVAQFTSISFERYALLLRSSITGFHSLTVYATDSYSIFNSAGKDSESLRGKWAEPAEIAAALEFKELYCTASTTDKNNYCLAMSIYDIHKQNLALVVVELVVEGSQSGVSNNETQIFTAIVDSLSDEVRLNSELENMTEALAKSYEELNLIYQAKEIVEDDEGLLGDGLKSLDN